MTVSDATLREGRAYIDRLHAGGGTMMAPALTVAFAQSSVVDAIRQIVFITDGNVGNEDALFRLIESSLGDGRLFTIGIGSAPNSHFMRGAARYGRGTFTYIADVAEVQPQMERLLRQITQPMLHDIELNWGKAVEIEAWPQRIPDLYRSEPVLVAMRARKLPATITVTGRIAGRDWRVVAELRGGQARRGVHVLWARRKIETLMDRGRQHGRDPAIRQAVVATALAHHLTSRYTSLIAVDVTPVRPAARQANVANVPTNLPAGWNHAQVFGRLPRIATSARPQLLLGAVLMMSAMVLLVIVRRSLRAA